MAKKLSQSQVDFLRLAAHRHGVHMSGFPMGIFYGPAKVLKRKGMVSSNGARYFATAKGYEKLKWLADRTEGRCWALSRKWAMGSVVYRQEGPPTN
jgi:hypothetical protein